MTNKKVDLSKLRDEIDNRKKNKGIVKETNVNYGKNMPKDSFLNELVTSLNTGKETESTKLIKMVENKAAEKKGETPINQINSNTNIESNKHPNQLNTQQQGDRDHLLFEELERKKKEMFNGGTLNSNTTPTNEQFNSNSTQKGGLITENQLNETVNNIIKDKFAHIVEQAMKDSIVEIYAETRMKEVLDENKEYIKNIVIETIRGLQKKKKSQQ